MRVTYSPVVACHPHYYAEALLPAQPRITMNPETCGHMPDHMGGVPPSGASVGLGCWPDPRQGHPPTEATTPPTEATTPPAEGVTINEPPNRAISEGTPKETEDEVSRLSAEVKRLSEVVFEQNGRLAALEAILHPDARQQADLEDQNAAQATITQQSLAQLRDIAQQLVTEQKALRAELTATRSESVHGAMLATLSAELANVALRVDSLQEASVDCSDALIAVRAELTATRSDVNVALLPFAHCHGASQSTEEFAGRLATVESAAVRLQEAAARVLIELNRVGTSHQNLQSQFSGARVELDQVRIDIGLVATRVEQESMRTGDVIHRVDQLESGSCCPCSNLAARLIGEPEPTD